MKTNRKGFTLIELLVVVLIIGILAAIALPQYTRTVEKSRASEALLNLKALSDAAQRLYLLNGDSTYTGIGGTDGWNNLDIDAATSNNFTFIASPTACTASTCATTTSACTGSTCTIIAVRSGTTPPYAIAYNLASGAIAGRVCTTLVTGNTTCNAVTPMLQ